MSFPITEATPIAHPGPPPGTADVAIVGGGIAGVMTGWFLARRGLRAVVVEKGRVAGEQSSRNWGWIRQQGRDPHELPIMLEANRLWPDLARATNEDIGLRRGGVTYLARDAAELERFEGWLVHARAHGIDSRMLSHAEVGAMFDGAARDWPGGLHTASDMRAEPARALPALARAAVRDGLCIVEDCAARTLDTGAGRVAGLVTEQGRIAAPEVLIAGGVWSRLFLARHGIALPQLSVRATVVATHALPELHPTAAADDRIAWRRRVDGGYQLAPGTFHELFVGRDAVRSLGAFAAQLRANPLGTRLYPAAPRGYPDAWGTPRTWDADRAGPFERMRVLNPAPNAAKVRQTLDRFARTFPRLGPVVASHAWAGMIDTMPDVVPVLDRLEAPAGLSIATGLSGHGFGIGPGIGRVMADLIAGAATGHDLSRFRLDRFAAPVTLSPGL